MRIYVNEMIRLWKNQGTIITIIIACVLTFVVMNIESKSILPYVQASDYKEAFENIKGDDVKETYKRYEDRTQELMEFSSEKFLCEAILGELEDKVLYDSYLDSIADTADSLVSISLFADEDSFPYRNAILTSEKYEKLKGKITIENGPSKGIELWSGNRFLAIVIVFVTLVIINELVLKDRESGQLNLFFTMDNGREKHGIIKVLVCVSSTFLVTLIILIAAFLSCDFIFGAGDITRTVQSVSGLRGCVMEVSVAGYMLIYYLMLSLTSSLTAIVIFMMSSLFSSSVMVGITLAVILGIEGVLYYLIGENSYLALLKEFNLMAFMTPHRYLSVYGNINIFGVPIERSFFVIVSVLVLMVVFITVSIKAYSSQNPIMGKKTGQIMPVRKKNLSSVSVLRHEGFKLFICGGTIWVMISFGICQIVFYSPAIEYFEDEDAVYYKGYVQKYTGAIDGKKMEEIWEEVEKFQKLEEERDSLLEKCTEDVAFEISSMYQGKLRPEAGLRRLAERAESLENNGGYIVYDTGYRLLTFDRMAKHKELILAIIAITMLVISVIYIFADDDRLYMDRLTSTMPKGRKKLLAKKLFIGSLAAFVIFIMNYMPYFFSILKTYGSIGLDFPAQSVKNLEGSIFEKMNFSIRESIVICLGLRYAVMLVVIISMGALSRKLRSLSRTMVVSLCAFVGPLLIMYVMR